MAKESELDIDFSSLLGGGLEVEQNVEEPPKEKTKKKVEKKPVKKEKAKQIKPEKQTEPPKRGKLKYIFYPGCLSTKVMLENYQASTAIAEKLGIELVELKELSCCGRGKFTDPELAIAINARNFAIAQKHGLDIMVICSTCLMGLSEARQQLDTNAALRERINGMLADSDLVYTPGIEIKHLLWILHDDLGLKKLKTFVSTPLTDVKIAPYYGCHILRPTKNFNTKHDQPDDPKYLESLIQALQGEVVDYEDRMACCGFHSIEADEETSMKNVGSTINKASLKSADCFVTPCPSCHAVFDGFSQIATKTIKKNIRIPMLHVSQLVGLALGLDEKTLGLQRHIIPAKNIIAKIHR